MPIAQVILLRGDLSPRQFPLEPKQQAIDRAKAFAELHGGSNIIESYIDDVYTLTVDSNDWYGKDNT